MARRLFVRKTLVVTLVVLVSAMWLAAQDSGQMGKSSGTTTIQGCLSSVGGHYQVTDSSGKVYQLSYDANKLAHHVGHEIKVTGTVDTSGAQSVVKVKTVTHIADTCMAGK
jgi:hypothetical protein